MSTTSLPADDVLTGLNSRLKAAQEMADDGGAVLRHYFTNQGWSVEDKADGSPVTTADRETEASIRKAIQKAFPGDGLIGEEYGDQDADGTTGFRWVIDPIDGTISFVHGVPMFGILIGIEHENRPLAGLMDFPILNERAFAVRGTGAWHQTCGQEPVPARVSNTCSLQEAMVCTTSFDYFRDHDYPDAYVALGQACRRTRGWSDCYSQLLLCTGRVDAVVEPELKRWDIGAIVPILQEAGGRFTDWTGTNDGDPGVLRGIASNSHVHEALVSIMKQWP